MRRDDGGQASVELVALLPVVALVGLLLLQAVVAGQAHWLAGAAARGAARAQAVGGDAAAGARAVLPRRLERGLRVRPSPRDNAVVVDVPVPSVLGGRLGHVRASARMEPQS